MIYTVTLNPSVDYVMECSDIKIGGLNRSAKESFFVGGKGINVSTMLKNLAVESICLGFTAGFTGEMIENTLTSMGIKQNFIRLSKGETRINVKLKGENETEINGSGPRAEKKEVDKLLGMLQKLNKDDVAVLSGSEIISDYNNLYELMAKSLNEAGVRFIADTSGRSLKSVLKHKPFLVKPNVYELEEFFGEKAENEEKIINLAVKLKKEGPENVLVSRGSKGAVIACKDNSVYSLPAPKGTKINTVGSGDSMVAGFVAGYMWYGDYEKAFLLSVAAGSATAFSENIASKEKVMELFEKISI